MVVASACKHTATFVGQPPLSCQLATGHEGPHYFAYSPTEVMAMAKRQIANSYGCPEEIYHEAALLYHLDFLRLGKGIVSTPVDQEIVAKAKEIANDPDFRLAVGWAWAEGKK